MTYREFWHPLTALYDEDEARSIARLVMERHFGLSLTDIACGAVEGLVEDELKGLRSRLLASEPVQYVLGEAVFCGRTFHVEPGVLIPRPETEWLCLRIQEIMNSRNTATTDIGFGAQQPCLAGSEIHPTSAGSKIHPTSAGSEARPTISVLDIGTGSGCIACTVALDGSDVMAALNGLEVTPALYDIEVTAWDISDRALAIARRNADALGARVSVERADALRPPVDDRRWDIIVSNPPYVCDSEREAMHANVLRHEPPEALFVPDDDPLLFYRAIAAYASRSLKDGGTLLFEINPRFSEAMERLLLSAGFHRVAIIPDLFGKSRFAEAHFRQASFKKCKNISKISKT